MEMTYEAVESHFALVDELHFGRERMLEPQDLPGRYGRVIKAIDHLLLVVGAEAVLGGGWAVWRHGFDGRMTQDVDILLAADKVAEFLQAASFSGFDVLPTQPGRWPKLLHKETSIRVDILPEGERPGTTSRPAPTTLPHPSSAGACGVALRYITLPALIELKLAAGRPRDEGDVAELIRKNPSRIDSIRAHLASVHPAYVTTFDHLVTRAADQGDE